MERAMRTVTIEPDFASWREAARGLLLAGERPEAVLWQEAGEQTSLFEAAEPVRPAAGGEKSVRVPAELMDLARTAAAHRDPQRWGVLYRLVWRVTHGERHLLGVPTDPDVRRVQGWAKAVGRDIHKMHAFVRFRQTGVDEATGREQFVAWFEPEHRIVRLAAPFFRRRFAGMDWSILTPDECVHWDGEALRFTAGERRESAPEGDVLDELWRTYYRSIFNPARLKVKAMQSEMPKKYWKNLPEAEIIDDLIAGSGGRVRTMLETEGRAVKPAPRNAYLEQLREMNGEES